jgi:peptidase E
MRQITPGQQLLLPAADVELDPERIASVHISGGYTDKLVKILRENGIDQKLTDYYQAGGIVYACSAGAIALGRDIRTAREVADDYRPSEGLGWVGEHSVVCHYRQEGHLPVSSVSRWSEEFPLLAIPNTSGLIYDNGELLSRGEVPCERWENGQTVVLPHVA